MQTIVNRTGFACLVALAAIALPSSASALAVIGGDTRLSFSSAISGLRVGLIGTTTLVGGAPGLTVNFDITGGNLVGLAGTIEHEGSGVTLSNGTNTLGLANFVIDTVNSLLLGDVTLNGASVANDIGLFSFDLATVTVAELTNLDNPLLSLLITPTASGALTAAFGLPDTTGVSVGLAATAPAVIPEPANWALLIAGFGLVGFAARRRRLAFAQA